MISPAGHLLFVSLVCAQKQKENRHKEKMGNTPRLSRAVTLKHFVLTVTSRVFFEAVYVFETDLSRIDDSCNRERLYKTAAL